MRSIGIVTVGRSDYGFYLQILRKIREDPDLHLHLLVSGTHLSPEFGLTVHSIEADGFEIGDRIEMLLSSDTPEAIVKSMGLGTIGFAQSYARFRPDILLVLGDRFEMHAAVLASLPFKIPVAHIHGGEITEGAIDNALRHSITKLSHLHFVANREYGRRVGQMGEEPWRVIVSGSPGLDNIRHTTLLTHAELEERLGIGLNKPPLLVTYHPVSLEYEEAERQVRELLLALSTFDMPMVFTMANADTNGRIITRLIVDFVSSNPHARFFANLGSHAYFSLMSVAAVMVGNSSSGIIEAPSFELPVVNIGGRQRGRIRAINVIDVGNGHDEIANGIRSAVSPEFRGGLRGMKNPYGSGDAARIIIGHLKETTLDNRLLVKTFLDVPIST